MSVTLDKDMKFIETDSPTICYIVSYGDVVIPLPFGSLTKAKMVARSLRKKFKQTVTIVEHTFYGFVVAENRSDD